MLKLIEELKRTGEELHLVKDHLLVRRDGAFHLLDTGVPSSMKAPDIVSSELEVPVTRLIGTAELARSPFRVDWTRRRIEFSASPAKGAIRHPITMSPLGVPLIQVEHRGRTITAVFDTGAPLSYMPSASAAGLDRVRTHTDFLPMFGSFDTNVYRSLIGVGTVRCSIELGVLPDLLQMALGLMLPDGWIIGTAIMKDRVTVIDIGGGAIWFED